MRKCHQDEYEEFNESSKIRGGGIKPGGPWLRDLEFCCCRIEIEDFYEKVSHQEFEVDLQEEVVPEVAVVAVAPLNVAVSEVPDNPESPPPSSPSLSTEESSPPPLLLRDLPSFMDFCTLNDLTEVEH